MNWESFYLVCFAVGLVLSVLSFAGGFGHLHLGHFHVGHTHAAHSHGNAVSPFNMFTAMAFLCWFGGAGYLLTHYRSFIAPVILGMSVLTGVAGAAIIFWFLAKVLLPHERVLLPEDTQMRGVIGRVSSSVRPEGLGEILFSLDGTRRSAAARSDNGQAIARETQVLVVRYEHGIAWVRPFTDLDDFDEPHTPT
jgi:membrane protein implicated in regulation of membrane protease activity